ncbi:MAG TPA: hypothetical protein PLZ79_13290 [Burkholderiales bacterium]|nr:hypothetical protein [Burkholderiales bacterium]
MNAVERLASIDVAILSLRSARDCLAKAGAKKAAESVRRTLKSVEGARRHAECLTVREMADR